MSPPDGLPWGHTDNKPSIGARSVTPAQRDNVFLSGMDVQQKDLARALRTSHRVRGDGKQTQGLLPSGQSFHTTRQDHQQASALSRLQKKQLKAHNLHYAYYQRSLGNFEELQKGHSEVTISVFFRGSVVSHDFFLESVL